MKSILSFQQVAPSSIFQIPPHQEHLLKGFHSLLKILLVWQETEALVEKSSV